MAKTDEPIIWAVIPARYQSRRFPGKMMAPLLGSPLLSHTVSMAQKIPSLSHVCVATDDAIIREAVESWGVSCRMTSPSCPNGSERIAEMIASLPPEERPDIVVNVQGDEPAFSPEAAERLIRTLLEEPETEMVTAVSKIETEDEWRDPSVVKCVMDQAGRALYFSRAPIPSLHPADPTPLPLAYRHYGVFVFRTPFLLSYASMAATPLQKSEDLEYLKILENGDSIRVVVIPSQPPGVDTPEDLEKVEALLCKKNTSLSPVASAHP